MCSRHWRSDFFPIPCFAEVLNCQFYDKETQRAKILLWRTRCCSELRSLETQWRGTFWQGHFSPDDGRNESREEAAKWAQPKAGTAWLPFFHSLTFVHPNSMQTNSRLLSRMGSGNDCKLPHEPLHSSSQEISVSRKDRCLITTWWKNNCFTGINMHYLKMGYPLTS